MSRPSLPLTSPANRAKAKRWIDLAPHGYRVEWKPPTRSVEQNALMWSLLGQLSKALPWHGQTYSDEDWKDYMMHALRRARWMPSEDGGLVPIGMRTSDLGVSEMTDLIELIFAFGARHGVEFREGREASAANNRVAAA